MKQIWIIIRTTATVLGTLFVYIQLTGCSNSDSHNATDSYNPKESNNIGSYNKTTIIVISSSNDLKKHFEERKSKLKDEISNNQVTQIERQDIDKKIINIDANYNHIRSLLESIKKFILKEDMNTAIAQQEKELINKGNIETIKSTLQKIVDNTDTKDASTASFKQGQLAEALVEYDKALFYYKKAVDFPDYDKKYRKKGIEFSKKLKLKEEEKYFENKLYYGTLKMDNGGTYRGVIKNGLASYCGVVKYNDGSNYIGQFNEGHRIGYGFSYIQGNEKPYLRRYNNDGKMISEAETVEIKKRNKKVLIGKMKNGRLEGRGLVLYSDKNILLANFKNGSPWNGTSCYFNPKEKTIIWRKYDKHWKKKGSFVIEKKK